MLIEFKTKNYKSFAEEVSFSMLANPKHKNQMDYSLFEKKSGRHKLKVLCSSVVYGANASGKSNIIGAMDTFRAIISKENIKNSSEISANPASSLLELIPNNTSENSEPVEFFIDFFDEDYRIQYKLVIDLGNFLDTTYDRKIVFEELVINNGTIFTRQSNQIKFHNLSFAENQLFISVLKNNKSEITADNKELFLTKGFKVLYSSSLAQRIINWFENKFEIIYSSNFIKSQPNILNSSENVVYINETIDKVAKLFGINSNGLGYAVKKDGSKPVLSSIFKGKENKDKILPAEIFESYGTQRFLDMFPVILETIREGKTLVVDELDCAIHPMAIMNIINIFHNDDININHAQLIFNTHNPIFLNSSIFRNDEIKFVERDDDNHQSTLYSLSDFNGVRTNEDYMKNYFVSQYGAIKDIDFSPVFEEALRNKKEED